MENKEDFKPYIPADKITPEFTLASIVTGVILAIVFGAANAYLGLRVGMTVSASIPAAVVAMAVMRALLRRGSILESNMVQTVGSAGESVAAGAIFTMPALYLWAKEGLIAEPSLLEVGIITVCGAILGVLFMIPLRNSIIVQEHGILPYPEAQACTKVLLAGEKNASGARAIFSGLGISMLVKFVIDGLHLIPGAISMPIHALRTSISTEIYPAVLGVGYICGFRISSFIFSGGLVSWLVLIPLIALFGGSDVIFPGTMPISEIYAQKGASGIWGAYIRYIGAGALAMAGILTLAKSLPLIIRTFLGAVRGLRASDLEERENAPRTAQDVSAKVVIIGSIAVALFLWLNPFVAINGASAVIVVLFGFFFATVSSKMVGLVGSSNNPVSGMTIATLLVATLALKFCGFDGAAGMVGAMSIAAIICIVAALAGDMSQDLKTGFLLGATPRKQQYGELIGAIVSALCVGGILMLLDRAWGFGSTELAAPQATLMKIVTEGVMKGDLPWEFVMVGACITIVFEVLRLPTLPIAIGTYLPLELDAAIMIGGVVRHFVDKRVRRAGRESASGILFCSGLVAGEGIVGVALAILAVCGGTGAIDLSRFGFGEAGGLTLLAVLCALIFGAGVSRKNGAKN